MGMTADRALSELVNLDGQYADWSRTDMFTYLVDRGLPLSLATRMEELWDKTKMIGQRVISIGKIIVLRILDFVEQHTNLAIGVAIGAAIGALVSLIPFIGHFLAPIAALFGIAVVGFQGHMIDLAIQNGYRAGISEGIITLAKVFFQLFSDIINALKGEFSG